MDEENKVNSVEENEETLPDGGEKSGASGDMPAFGDINAELERLRGTFQKTYDETAAEAQDEPVIQELDDEPPAGTEKDEDSAFEPSAEITAGKPKKKRKKGKTAAVVISVVLCLIIFVPLILFFVMSVTQPNFSSFVSAYTRAASAESYEDKNKALNEALGYCKGDSALWQAMAMTVAEEIVSETYKEKGYTEAYAAMERLMAEQQLAHPSGRELREFLQTGEKIKELSGKAFLQVFANLGDTGAVPGDEVIFAGFDIPEKAADEIKGALKTIAEGYVLDKKAAGLNDRLAAVNSYSSAYNALCALGADKVPLAENICVTLYNNGFAVEAAALSSTLLKDAGESTNSDYTAVRSKIDSAAAFKASICSLSRQAFESGKTSKDDILALVKTHSALDDVLNGVLAEAVALGVDAVKAEKGKNLTLASSVYANLCSVLDFLNIKDSSARLKSMEVLFRSGNLSALQPLVQQYAKDELKAAASQEQKKLLNEIERTITALDAASNAFGPYIAGFYQAGTPIDPKTASEALDALITDKSDRFDKAFVAYCKYFAVLYSEGGGKKDTLRYVEEIKKLIPEQIFIYGSLELDEYVKKQDFASAEKTAVSMLGVNAADEHANGILSLTLRANGNVDASLAAALKGMELSGERNLCARQAAIDYILKGENEKAYELVNALYTSTMSMDSCELMLVLNHIYKGKDEQVRSGLAKAAGEIKKTYAQYSVKSYKSTLAVLDGSKTVQDVFLSGNYELADGE